MSTKKINISKFLKKMRRNGVIKSYGKMAKLLGYSPQYIHMLTTGARLGKNPILKLAQSIDVSPEALIFISLDPPAEIKACQKKCAQYMSFQRYVERKIAAQLAAKLKPPLPLD